MDLNTAMINQEHSNPSDSSENKKQTKILFVCLGNICRSPAAECVARHIAQSAGRADFCFDSAGLYGGHVGQQPDKRMLSHAYKRGYKLNHSTRQVCTSDFYDFDVIIAMDDSNYRQLRNMAPSIETEQKIVRMASFITSFPEYDYVPDPYYEGYEGFELVLDMLEEGCGKIIETDFKR